MVFLYFRNWSKSIEWGGVGHGFFYTPHFQMLRPAHPPVLFDQSLIAHTYFCSGDIKQMICCCLFSSPSSISSASIALPSTQLGEVSERIKADQKDTCTWSLQTGKFHHHAPFVSKIFLYLHSLCVDILFNSLPWEFIDVTSDVNKCRGYPWASKFPFPPQ